MERRDFLKVSTLGIAGAGLLSCAKPTSRTPGGLGTKPGRKPRNIIFMCSDGMSMGVPSMAQAFCQRYHGRDTQWAQLLEDTTVSQALMETYSLNALVTDSSAASSTWGSGVRIMNGAVNQYPDGTKLRHIGGLVKDSGRGMGLVTTTTVTHATPAGFAANAASRSMEEDIAPQYRNVVDVIMGGGNRFFDPTQRKDQHDLYADYAASGYKVARSRDEMMAASGSSKILGVYYDGHLPYTIDQNQDARLKREVPTLAEMTKAAIESLDRHHTKGFLLQVEGGRVDHAAHGNDAAAMIHDQIAFDDAIAVAVDFARRSGDTLVVITADHANANPGMTFYDRANGMFDAMSGMKASLWPMIDAMREAGGPKPSAANVGDVIKRMAGFEITGDDAQLLADALGGNPPRVINMDMRSTNSIFGQILGNYTGVHFMASSHTQDLVLLSAVGPGQEHFDGFVKNIECFNIMTDLFGIAHRNKQITLEEALAQQARLS
jgi:alkaline phosphatase